MGTRDKGHKASNSVVASAVLFAGLAVARVAGFVMRADAALMGAGSVIVDVPEVVFCERVKALGAFTHTPWRPRPPIPLVGGRDDKCGLWAFHPLPSVCALRASGRLRLRASFDRSARSYDLL